MNFIVTQARTKNTIIWKKIVAFRFTVVSLLHLKLRGHYPHEAKSISR